jgi:hypothetical protein
MSVALAAFPRNIAPQLRQKPASCATTHPQFEQFTLLPLSRPAGTAGDRAPARSIRVVKTPTGIAMAKPVTDQAGADRPAGLGYHRPVVHSRAASVAHENRRS